MVQSFRTKSIEMHWFRCSSSKKELLLWVYCFGWDSLLFFRCLFCISIRLSLSVSQSFSFSIPISSSILHPNNNEWIDRWMMMVGSKSISTRSNMFWYDDDDDGGIFSQKFFLLSNLFLSSLDQFDSVCLIPGNISPERTIRVFNSEMRNRMIIANDFLEVK